MPVSPDTLQLLIDAGLEGDDLMRVVRSIAADNPDKKRSAGAERQARYRDKKRMETVTDNVTSDATSDVTESVTPRAHVEDNLLTKETTGQGRKKTTREEQAEFVAELSSLLDADRVQALVDVRKKKNGKLNAHAARLLVGKIQTCGLTPIEAADTMALRNWISIEASWVQRDHPRSTSPPKKETAFDAYAEIAKAKGWDIEPEIIPGADHDVEFLPAERGQHSGAVVDIRTGVGRRFGPRD